MTSQLAAPLYIYLRARMAFVDAVVFDISLAQPGRMWIQKRGTREAPLLATLSNWVLPRPFDGLPS